MASQIPATSWKDLASLEEQLRTSKKRPDVATVRKFLKGVRDNGLRRSELVAKLGKDWIQRGGFASQDEKWQVHEQVCAACCDIGDVDSAAQYVKALEARFPESVRVGILRGMMMEAQGLWDAAFAHYETLLEKMPNSEPTHKRLVALLRARGRIADATEALSKYLEIWQADTEGWLELADLYVAQQQYKQAAFCYEEVLAAAPGNAQTYVKYAEVLYTQGTEESVRSARRYFAAAAEASDGLNLRALYGVSLCAAFLARVCKGRADAEGSEAGELGALAEKRLLQVYSAKVGAERTGIVRSALEAAGKGKAAK